MTPQTETRTRIAAVDGLRGLAALTVLTLHTWYASGQPVLDTPIGPFVTTLVAAGYVGVDFFFVISGFVLFLPTCLREGEFGSVHGYAVRRAARILPLYWLTLAAVVVALSILTKDPLATKDVGINVLLHLTFLQHTVGGVLGLPEGFRVNGVIWTLTLEVLFYALLPLFAQRFYRNPALWFGAFFAISAVWRFGATAWADPISQAGPTIYGLMLLAELPTYLPHFAMGMGAAWLYVRLRKPALEPTTSGAEPATSVVEPATSVVEPGETTRSTSETTTLDQAALGLTIVGTLGVVWGMHELGVEDLFKTGGPYGHLTGTLPVAAAFTCGLLGLLLGPSWVRRPFNDVTLRKLGDISYGTYLWHLIVIGWLATNLTLPMSGSKPFVVWFGLVLSATLVLAWVSHVAIERPAIRWARRHTSTESANVSRTHAPHGTHPGGMHGAYILFAIYVLFLGVLLFSPEPIEDIFGVRLGLWQGRFEEIGNILVFVPIGLVAARRLPRRWQALLLGVGLACLVELVQYAWLPHRTPSFDDIIKNSIGTAIGVLLELLHRQHVHRHPVPDEPPPAG